MYPQKDLRRSSLVLQRLECDRACALYYIPQVKQQITQNNDLYRQNAQTEVSGHLLLLTT